MLYSLMGGSRNYLQREQRDTLKVLFGESSNEREPALKFNVILCGLITHVLPLIFILVAYC